MFSDGIIAQAATKVSNNGAAYFSSAGNSARASWEADFSGVRDDFLDNLFLLGFNIPVGFWDWHDFDGEGTTLQEINVQNVVTQTVILQWNDRFLSQGQGAGASNDFDILVFNEDNEFLGAGSTNRNIGGGAYCALHIVQRRMCTLYLADLVPILFCSYQTPSSLSQSAILAHSSLPLASFPLPWNPLSVSSGSLFKVALE
jgi:hypothetical protein